MQMLRRLTAKAAAFILTTVMLTACLAKAEPIQAGSRAADSGPGAVSQTQESDASGGTQGGVDAAASKAQSAGAGEISITDGQGQTGVQDTDTLSQSGTAAQTEQTSAAQNYDALIQKTQYARTSLNIRTQPSTDAPSIGRFASGDAVSVIATVDEKWTGIVYGGQPAYVATEYLTDDKSWRENLRSDNGYADRSQIALDTGWTYAGYSEIHSGTATMYLATGTRKNRIVGVNAGHGTSGGTSVKTWCHPDQTAKVTGGTTAAGATKAVAVSTGMTFADGTAESRVTLREAQILKELLLSEGYDVLMIRDSDDVQLDNVARTVICNNVADCHIAIHWDGDGLSYDKGCFYMSVPDALKSMEPVSYTWQKSERLGDCLISGLKTQGCKIMGEGSMDMDLTQTSFSTIASVDIELGNQSSDHSEETLTRLAQGLLAGVNAFFTE